VEVELWDGCVSPVEVQDAPTTRIDGGYPLTMFNVERLNDRNWSTLMVLLVSLSLSLSLGGSIGLINQEEGLT
jgi:hypothetical protein